MIIDGGAWYGRDPTSPYAVAEASPLPALAGLGITKALTAPYAAGLFDMRRGNDELFAASAASGGALIPMPLVVPLSYDSSEDYLAELKARGAKAIFLNPGISFDNWTWSSYAVKAIARDAAAIGLPIQVGLRSGDELAEVARVICPEGGKVLVRWMRGSGYRLSADLLALGRDFEDLMFDVGTQSQSGIIEHLAERLGAERLFVASNHPSGLASSALFLAFAARLSDADRTMILGGSLARALRLPLPNAVPQPPASWTDLVARPKIDTHWHTSGWNIMEPRTGEAAMRAEFDSFNYRFVCSSSICSMLHDLAGGNTETAAFCDLDSRVKGYVVVNPLHLKDSLAELDKYAEDPRFIGIKSIQDFYGMDLDDAGYAPILEKADAMGWPVMAHLPGMAKAARRWPNVKFIAAHSTWRPTEFRDLPNVYCDIATSTALRHEVRLPELFESVGEDRVIFSCDGQLMSPALTLGKVAEARLSETALGKLFMTNALAVLPRILLGAA